MYLKKSKDKTNVKIINFNKKLSIDRLIKIFLCKKKDNYINKSQVVNQTTQLHNVKYDHNIIKKKKVIKKKKCVRRKQRE